MSNFGLPLGFNFDDLIGVPSFNEKEKEYPPRISMEGSLLFIRSSECGWYALISQPVTRDEKWVHKKNVDKDGALVAFYDADSTYLPESERA